jgi:hypothetical protein
MESGKRRGGAGGASQVAEEPFVDTISEQQQVGSELAYRAIVSGPTILFPFSNESIITHCFAQFCSAQHEPMGPHAGDDQTSAHSQLQNILRFDHVMRYCGRTFTLSALQMHLIWRLSGDP